MATSGCTITHNFGPFSGKVVDAETGEPIEGAVVLIGFSTKSGSPGGWSWKFADAIEIMTDANGDFHLPPKRVSLFRVNAIWDKDCKISIFKPGYAAYPGHPKTFSSWKEKRSRIIPQDEYITYYLPRLRSLEKRKDNLLNVEKPGGIPNKKMPNLRRLRSEERENVGLKPFSEK